MTKVEATAGVHAGLSTADAGAVAADVSVAAHRLYSGFESAYARLAEMVPSPALQSASWVETYEREHGGEFLYLAAGPRGAETLALALAVRRSFGLTLLGFIGGSHANGNFPAVDPRWHAPDSHALRKAITKAARAAMPKADVIVLERQLKFERGVANPLVGPNAIESPNVALSADLSQGFDHLMSVISGRRKRKKNRSQARKFEAAGGYRFFRATTSKEVDLLFDAFLAAKDVRFRASGIENVFTPESIQRFMRALFKGELGKDRPRFFFDALEVGGKIRAVTASSVSGPRLTCEFASICEDELAQYSPGEFLFFHNIEQAAKDGFCTYDFGVGDEHYKRMWCNVETVHYDTLIPLTAKGTAFALAWRAVAAIKRKVKRGRVLWPVVKHLRQKLRGQSNVPVSAETED